MRGLPALSLALLALLAGCADDGPATDGSSSTTTSSAPAAPLPEPIHDSQAVTASADPTNAVEECMAPSAQCFEYPFELEGGAEVSIALAWGLPANDFDLYLYSGGSQVALSAAGATTEEAIESSLDAGSYVVVVSAFAVSQDTFTLDVTFA